MFNSATTVILYTFTIIFSIVTAKLACKSKKDIANGTVSTQINFLYMAISFAALWLLLSFSVSGNDYKTYAMLFDNAKNFDFIIGYHEIELGFAYFNYIISCITINSNIYFFVLNFIFVFLVYFTLYKLRDRLDFISGIVVFTTTFYFQAMCLKRIYLAAAVVFFSIQYLIKKEYFKYVLMVIIATLFHRSAIIMLVPLVLDILVGLRIPKKMLFSLVLFFIGVCYFFRFDIASVIYVHRYVQYETMDGHLGIMQFFFHLPLLLVFKWKYSNYDDYISKRYLDIGILLSIISFSLGILSYYFEMIGRAFVYFMFPYVLALSICKKSRCSKSLFKINRNKFFLIMMYLFFIIRLAIYYKEGMVNDGNDIYATFCMTNNT